MKTGPNRAAPEFWWFLVLFSATAIGIALASLF